MKNIALLLTVLTSSSVFGQSTAQDAYVKGAIGAISVIGLILLIGVYKLGKVLVLKVKPAAPRWIQRTSGAALVVAFFILASAFGK